MDMYDISGAYKSLHDLWLKCRDQTICKVEWSELNHHLRLDCFDIPIRAIEWCEQKAVTEKCDCIEKGKYTQPLTIAGGRVGVALLDFYGPSNSGLYA